jgi:hypothetical protein
MKGENSLDPLSLSLSNPRLPGTSPLGLASLNRKDLPIVVTLGGVGLCYASLAFYFIAFAPSYKLCDNSHLRQVFERCQKYGISLNPSKSILGVDEGKLLGHIITKDGVKMDPEMVQVIQQVPLPTKKALQSFLGQINFVRRFIPNLAKTLKPIERLLKKDVKFEWTEEGRRAFKIIKNAVGKSPVLISPNYAKDFQIFSFAYEDTIARVLLQKNDDCQEQPIVFTSKALQNSELNYTTMEKQAYALVKSLKHFQVYIVLSHGL